MGANPENMVPRQKHTVFDMTFLKFLSIFPLFNLIAKQSLLKEVLRRLKILAVRLEFIFRSNKDGSEIIGHL